MRETTVGLGRLTALHMKETEFATQVPPRMPGTTHWVFANFSAGVDLRDPRLKRAKGKAR